MKLDADKMADRRNATYAMYQKLHASRTLYPIKTIRSVMTELMYAEPEAWRAVGITRAALTAYADAGHRYVKGIQRAHLTDREKMIQNIFEPDEPFDYDALFDYWLKTDQTVIAMKIENLTNQLGEWIPFDNEEAVYFQREGIGFRYRPAIEGLLTRKLVSKLV